MKLHNWHAIGWGVIVTAFVAWEAIGLRKNEDEAQPFTWYVRKLARVEPLWFLLLGFLLWLPYHFLIKHNK